MSAKRASTPSLQFQGPSEQGAPRGAKMEDEEPETPDPEEKWRGKAVASRRSREKNERLPKARTAQHKAHHNATRSRSGWRSLLRPTELQDRRRFSPSAEGPAVTRLWPRGGRASRHPVVLCEESSEPQNLLDAGEIGESGLVKAEQPPSVAVPEPLFREAKRETDEEEHSNLGGTAERAPSPPLSRRGKLG
ncbi:hypothetical protein E2320_014375 [Naja naja]|nr:hypothetical protein E2320_014375 [Naja naja]